jgi:uncharacterized protein (DUF1778 family)
MATALTKSKKEMSRRLAPAVRKLSCATVEFPTEIVLSPRDSKQFLRHLNHPPRPNQKLKEAVARFKKTAGGNV